MSSFEKEKFHDQFPHLLTIHIYILFSAGCQTDANYYFFQHFIFRFLDHLIHGYILPVPYLYFCFF